MMNGGFAATPLGARLRLVRFSNVFSPVADVLCGVAVARASILGNPIEPGPPIDVARVTLAILASLAIYQAGMILNDVADREDDTKTRPDRPIPSGKVSVREAVLLGAFLTMFALAASYFANNWQIVAPLAAVVLLYDFVTKRGSLLGPLLLGAARSLNFLAGVVAGDYASKFPVYPPAFGASHDEIYAIAYGYGFYICGISIFAIQEDRPFSRIRTAIAALVSIGGLLLAFDSEFLLPLLWIPLIEPISVAFARGPFDAARIGMMVGAGLRSTLVFHAIVAISVGSPGTAAFCGIGYIGARILARWIPPN
ncbi:MAG: UbiA family prenyltransferase [Planctomycetota bacterium]